MSLNSRFRVALNSNKNSITTLMSVVFGLFTHVITRVNSHGEKKGNVHGLTRGDIGLDLVPNWGPATRNKAVAGVNNTSVVTPKRMDEYVKKNIYDELEALFDEAADKI